MSEAVTLSGTLRQVGRKGPSRQLRREGKLPGIIYGHGENVAVTLDAKELLKLLEIRGGSHSVIHSRIEGDKKERSVMIKSLDVHPIYDTLMHIDLLEIDETKPMKLDIELEFIGVPVGVKEKGGELRIQRKKLLIECLPKDIPARLEVYIKDMEVGQILCAKDIKHADSVSILTDPEAHVVTVVPPKQDKTAKTEETEGGAAGAKAAPAKTAPAAASPDKKNKK
ncbi:MAG: 50S ribosomal protein L25 [Nitrospinota bacterium]|nr:50S ribosomal protein L25 [Nitrospinota bacterium]